MPGEVQFVARNSRFALIAGETPAVPVIAIPLNAKTLSANRVEEQRKGRQ